MAVGRQQRKCHSGHRLLCQLRTLVAIETGYYRFNVQNYTC